MQKPVLHNLSSINPSKIGENREPATPSQPVIAGGVETVVAKRSEFKGLIAGMLLGDGCLSLSGGKNAFVRIQHSIKQADYLIYKAQLLESLTNVNIYDIKPSKRTPYSGIACKTRRHPLYTRIYEIVYRNSKKTISKTWLSWLNEHGLALWYMDDGSLLKRYTYNKSDKRRICSRIVRLNTCGFSLDENQLLIDFMRERFGIEFKLLRNGKYWLIRLGAKEANKFFDIIRPYIVPCMKYKIDMQYQQPNEGRSIKE